MRVKVRVRVGLGIGVSVEWGGDGEGKKVGVKARVERGVIMVQILTVQI